MLANATIPLKINYTNIHIVGSNKLWLYLNTLLNYTKKWISISNFWKIPLLMHTNAVFNSDIKLTYILWMKWCIINIVYLHAILNIKEIKLKKRMNIKDYKKIKTREWNEIQVTGWLVFVTTLFDRVTCWISVITFNATINCYFKKKILLYVIT